MLTLLSGTSEGWRRLRAMLGHLCVFRVDEVLLFRHERLCTPAWRGDIRPVNHSNIDDIRHSEPSNMLAQFRSFLDRGDAGYYAYEDGQPAHRSWVQFGPSTAQCEMGVTFPLGRQDCCIHYCVTYPAARGRGIYTAVLDRIARDARSEGKTVFIATVRSNLASIRGIKRAGFSLIGRVRAVVLFGAPVFRSRSGRL